VIVFADESGFSLLPAVRATWAPRGHTPVLRHRFNWKRLSMAGALVYWPDASQAALVFPLRPGAYNDVRLIEFLTDLHTHLDGHRVLLIWDGLPSHRSRTMTAWLGHAAVVAARRAAPRLRSRPQPHRTGVGQREEHRVGQPVPRHHRRRDQWGIAAVASSSPGSPDRGLERASARREPWQRSGTRIDQPRSFDGNGAAMLQSPRAAGGGRSEN
jgi:DDE superfamily endonuclease